MKDLICHMIGIFGFLNKNFKAHFISKMLKKELSDLKSYFQELGYSYEPVKENGHDDYLVRRPHGADSLQFVYVPKAKAEEENQEPVELKAEVIAAPDEGEKNKRRKK